MKFQMFRSLWTNGYDLAAGLGDCAGGPYDGIEGPVPVNTGDREVFVRSLDAAGVPLIAEVVTGGDYVPRHDDAGRHLEDVRATIENSIELEPIFFNILAGCDSWPLAKSIEFIGSALEVAAEYGVDTSFETHRSRSTFTPWQTRDLLEQLPGMWLTSDFSHWCCVCERLVVDDDSALLELFASRTRHVHGRVGYDQGPGVPHPAADEYAPALEAHERWWRAIWTAQADAGFQLSTMAAEHGPDGYMPKAPFTAEPLASLDEVNGWIATREAEQFATWAATRPDA